MCSELQRGLSENVTELHCALCERLTGLILIFLSFNIHQQLLDRKRRLNIALMMSENLENMSDIMH